MLEVQSRAKVNLFLRVVGKRPDGFHELETLMQEVSLADTLWFEEAEELRLEVDRPGLPTDQSNLIVRAAELLRRECDVRRGARIQMEKRIPVGGGLGGGSSNCAATLTALNRLWKLGLSEAELKAFGARLGSDVCFFVTGGTALCGGRGEIVTPVTLSRRFDYLLIVPPFSCSTPEVYRNLKLDLTDDHRIGQDMVRLLQEDDIVEIRKRLFNDLESAAFGLYPKLNDLASWFEQRLELPVLLSGSGSTLFCMLDEGGTHEREKALLEDRPQEVEVLWTRGVC